MYTEDEDTIESPSASTLELIWQDDEDEVIDLTNASDMTVIQ